MDNFIFSVTQLNGYIKELLDCDPALSNVFVRGELSNYKCYPSGHHYFSLKDETGSLRCVMFKREAARLRFRPENGMKLIAFGRVTVFPRDGQYQLYCTELTPDGVGDLHVAFEQLKEKLQREGLFAPERKRALPPFPDKIALITSPVGAVVRDMLRILKARWPMTDVLVVPVRVQGEQAAGEIAAAIDYVNQHALADLIITGRGGGSMEDLWAFNEEMVARAIDRSRIPIISAVGHEPDVTIADFVADLRAATPSNAAELAVPDRVEIARRLRQKGDAIARELARTLTDARRSLERVRAGRVLRDPAYYVSERRMALDGVHHRLGAAAARVTAREGERLGRAAAKLDALSPLKVLARGYAIAQTEAGVVVTKVSDLERGDTLSLRVSDGTVPCQVI